jgi:hypothetical protein
MKIGIFIQIAHHLLLTSVAGCISSIEPDTQAKADPKTDTVLNLQDWTLLELRRKLSEMKNFEMKNFNRPSGCGIEFWSFNWLIMIRHVIRKTNYHVAEHAFHCTFCSMALFGFH